MDAGNVSQNIDLIMETNKMRTPSDSTVTEISNKLDAEVFSEKVENDSQALDSEKIENVIKDTDKVITDNEVDDHSEDEKEIDFDNDMSDVDNDIAKPVNNESETKLKSSDGFPHIDFSLIKLRDLNDIVIPDIATLKQAGIFLHTMEYDRSIMVESLEGIPTFHLGTILFRDNGEPLGEVCDIIGNVNKPFYSLNFKTMDEIKEKNLKKGEPIFYSPGNFDFTVIVREQDVNTYGTDASGAGDLEASEEEFSDDEKEVKHKKKQKLLTSWPVEKNKGKATSLERKKVFTKQKPVHPQNYQSMNNPSLSGMFPPPSALPPGYPHIPPSYPQNLPSYPPTHLQPNQFYPHPPTYPYGGPPPQTTVNTLQWPPQQVPTQWPPQQVPTQWPPQQVPPQQVPTQWPPQQVPPQQVPTQWPPQQVPPQWPQQQVQPQWPPQQVPPQWPHNNVQHCPPSHPSYPHPYHR